jgi:hypothetical protein
MADCRIPVAASVELDENTACWMPIQRRECALNAQDAAAIGG